MLVLSQIGKICRFWNLTVTFFAQLRMKDNKFHALVTSSMLWMRNLSEIKGKCSIVEGGCSGHVEKFTIWRLIRGATPASHYGITAS